MGKTQYLIKIQYLGFRFHGWAKQPNLKTVHQMVDKTIHFILDHERFKTLGASRTDAMVSANQAGFALFVEEILQPERFLAELNDNLPQDIRALDVRRVEDSFNIIQAPSKKEYAYLFTFGEKPHPFSAPFLTFFKGELNVELMKTGAKLFVGTHNFRSYCSRASAKTNFEREILFSEIRENDMLKADFIPEKSFAFHVHGKGFLYNQVRLMMGQLVRLGREEIDLKEIKTSLSDPKEKFLPFIAPASGLILNRISFDL